MGFPNATTPSSSPANKVRPYLVQNDEEMFEISFGSLKLRMDRGDPAARTILVDALKEIYSRPSRILHRSWENLIADALETLSREETRVDHPHIAHNCGVLRPLTHNFLLNRCQCHPLGEAFVFAPQGVYNVCQLLFAFPLPNHAISRTNFEAHGITFLLDDSVPRNTFRTVSFDKLDDGVCFFVLDIHTGED